MPAKEIEQFVIDRIRCIGRDASLVQATLAAAREKMSAQTTAFEQERSSLERDLVHADAEVRQLTAGMDMNDENAPGRDRVAIINERIRVNEARLGEIRQELAALQTQVIDEEALCLAPT